MRPTPEMELQVLGAIRGGAFPHVAAAAFGVPRPVFVEWMHRGRQQQRGAYRAFWLKVEQARGQARAVAEHEARDQDLKFWLRYGPGKGGLSSWGAVRRQAKPGGGDAMADPTFRKFLAGFIELLEPHPELRQAVTALVGQCWKTKPRARGRTARTATGSIHPSAPERASP